MRSRADAPGGRLDLGLVISIIAIVVVGIALTLGFLVFSKNAAEQRALEAADLLARDALRTFAAAASAERLEALPVGSDSVMSRTRVRAGGDYSGAAIVLVRRPSESTYLIRSTGRLDTIHGPVFCSVDLAWRPAAGRELDIPARIAATCNGKRRERLGTGVPPRAS